MTDKDTDILRTPGSDIARQVTKRAREDAQGMIRDGYQAIQVDRGLAEKIDRRQDETPPAIKVRPHKDSGGVQAGRGLLRSLHTIDRSRWRGKNVSTAHSFETRYIDDDGAIALQFVPGDESWTEDLETHIKDNYPGALTTPTRSELIDLSEGRWFSGADLELDRYTLHLIKNIDLEDFDRNPWGAITSEIASAARRTNANVDIVCQIVYRPAEKPWKTGVDDGKTVSDIIHNLTQPNIEHRRNNLLPWKKERMETPPSTKEKQAAKVMGDLYGEEAWNLNVRVFASADTPEAAELAVEKVANKFENYYESSTQQKFVPRPLCGAELRKGIVRAVSRQWTDNGLYFSEAETAGLVNCMDDQINTAIFNWALANPGEGLPPGVPEYDFEAAGVENATWAEQYLTMRDRPEFGDDAFWVGRDQANGKEAGIYEWALNAHTQKVGATRMGKSTQEQNMASQAWEKGHGALVITMGKDDNKDDSRPDDEELIAEWPEDRPREDFVFVDTGDAFEKMVRINLLSIPDHLEPGSAEHTSYMESMCDDFCASFAQAGGDGELYPLMRGLTRTTVRGMAMANKTCTPLDLAAACSSSENMAIFHQWMDEERIHYIRETVERFKEKEDADFEPIARRMDEIIHNATLRKLLSAREPTVDIQQLVDEDKVIFLRLDEALGDTEMSFLTTPYVRKVAHAKKMSDSATPYHVFWDEADKAITVHSNVGRLLSIMGGYGMYFHLTYQAPSHQLPPDLWEAAQSEVNTTISYRTRGANADKIAKLLSEDITSTDLTYLPRYTFYMSTETADGEITDSIMIEAPRPIRELRAEVQGVDPMTDEEIDQMKADSLDHYGEVPESEEERRAQSHFFAGSSTDETEETDEDDEEDEITETIRAQTCKAVFDQAIREHGDGTEWVRLDVAAPRIRRYLPDDLSLSTTEALWGNTVEKIPRTLLEREDRDGEMHLRCTEEGLLPIFEQGSDQNAAGPLHRKLLNNSYAPLTEAGFVVSIPVQEGTEELDAKATLADVDPLQFDEDATPKQIHDGVEEFKTAEEYALLNRLSDGETVSIEAEESTGATAPAQTVINLAKALNQGRRCLFVCRTEEIAQKVWNHLNEAPLCMRSTSREGCHRYYNQNDDALRIDGEVMYRPGGARDTAWFYDTRTGEIVLSDSDGEDHARFDSPEEVFSDPSKYPSVEGADESTHIKPPAIPEWMIDGAVDPSRWDVLVSVEGENEGVDRLAVFEDGDLTPLSELGAGDGTEDPLAHF